MNRIKCHFVMSSHFLLPSGAELQKQQCKQQSVKKFSFVLYFRIMIRRYLPLFWEIKIISFSSLELVFLFRCFPPFHLLFAWINNLPTFFASCLLYYLSTTGDKRDVCIHPKGRGNITPFWHYLLCYSGSCRRFGDARRGAEACKQSETLHFVLRDRANRK